MHIENWFPVQIGHVDLDEEVRKATDAKVLAWLENNQPGHHAEDTLRTTYFGEKDLIQQAGLVELQEEILKACYIYLRTLGVAPPLSFSLESWVNVFDHNSSEQIHDHFGAILSGCYYVKAPEGSGSFFVPDPIGERRMWGTHTFLETEDCTVKSHAIYEATPGRMLVFQSWMPHGVFRQAAQEPRISVAFNLQNRWK
jgi:uncharacterized protein (TIGR02466 family)